MKRLMLVGFTIAGLLVGPSIAAAQNSSVDAYGGAGQAPVSVLGANATSPPSSNAGSGANTASGAVAGVATPTAAVRSPGGSLPFTGLDLLLIAAGGIALVGVGFAVRRFTSPSLQ
jgi:hypothetical protein